MDKESIEKYRQAAAQNESLQNENKKLKNLLGSLKGKLEEINLQNARLLYANRVLGDTSLNEQQKNKIVGLVGTAGSVEEAKMMYETLQKTMASTSVKGAPQSLSEVVSQKSSVILGGSRREPQEAEHVSTKNRWATLAGLPKK